MKKIILLILSLLLITCENPTETEQENTSWIFVANEGNYGTSQGSISMIDDFGNVYETDAIGDVVQALAVYKNKLIVLINNSHMIKIYDINENGLSLPGIEISTNNSSPRDLVVLNDKVYFTNWNSQDIKVFDLFNYNIETSIPVNGLPEDIEFDGEYLWVTIPHSDSNFNTGNTVCKINPNTNLLIETIEVGNGPQEIVFDIRLENEGTQNEEQILLEQEILSNNVGFGSYNYVKGIVNISRTFYDENWNTFHGATKIGSEIIENTYGIGTPCGGAILKHQNMVYRSFDGGLSPMNPDLSLDVDNKIGNYNQNLVYHVEEINGNIWFALTDFSNYNEVKVINSIGEEIHSYQIGILPGDFAVWPIND